MGLIETWRERGFVHQISDALGLDDLLQSGPVGVYCGFDPTADSLQIGNLVPIMMLAYAQDAGHLPVVVQGGMTGLIGDPSGKTLERQLLDREAVAANVALQAPIFEAFLDFDASHPNPARRFDNFDWLGGMSAIELLRDYGKLVSVNQMLQRENVRQRLERAEQGISFTEFSYGILQAIDFARLFEQQGVAVQIGGSDQWGNIVGGIEFVRRLHGQQAFGVTAPLVTRTDGQKFGKTEAGSVWLTAGRTSPFAYYQFWMNSADNDVSRYLRLFTKLSIAEINDTEGQHIQDPSARIGQRRLATEATALLHGAEAAARAARASEAVFSGNITRLDETELSTLFADLPHATLTAMGRSLDLIEVLVEVGLASSKREARQFVSAGAVHVNGHVAASGTINTKLLLHGRFALLARGRRERLLLQVVS